MSKMRKMVWSKFKSPFTRTGKCEREDVEFLVDKSSVNKEYGEFFRTKSYIDTWNKVQAWLGRKSLDRLGSDYLLKQQQETLINMIEGSNLHHLVINYFKASFEACNICISLLRGIHQARANYRIINKVIELTEGMHDSKAIFAELSSFAMLKNPLLTISPSQFQDMHDSHGSLLDRLTMKLRKVRRRANFSRSCNGLAKKGCNLVKRGFETSFDEQLEVAARGVYVLTNNFDTMSRLVSRLQDEIEHSKAIADMCVRNGKREMLKEVVREFRINQTCFLEQLEELEEHIYLCFLNINRSSTLVM